MRYKEFNTNTVLEKAINLFWQKGFNPCPISEIVKETGVNRFSLYQEFDNKEGILEKALQLYLNRYANKYLEKLEGIGNVTEKLKSFFFSYLDNTKMHPPGCFIIQVGTELADQNLEIKLFLTEYLNEIEKEFFQLMEKEGNKKEKSAFYARHLTALFCNTMCFSVIHTRQEQERIILNGMNLILKKQNSHVTQS